MPFSQTTPNAPLLLPPNLDRTAGDFQQEPNDDGDTTMHANDFTSPDQQLQDFQQGKASRIGCARYYTNNGQNLYWSC